MNKCENVILLTVDSLRLDHLGLYGCKKEISPNLDRLASESVVFTEAISNGSHTAISFPAILTSTYGSMYGGYGYLSDERVSVAEVLHEKGYTTAAFHSNPYLSAVYNYNKGFDVFYDSMKNDFSSFSFKVLDRLVGLAHERKQAKTLLSFMLKFYSYIQPYKIPYERGEVITQKAINWLKECNDKFFLWIHYMDTHWPWVPSASFLSGDVGAEEASKLGWKMLTDSTSISEEELKKLIDLYDDQIRYMDYNLGKLFHKLREMGLYDNALTILAADHGEEFKEHGDIGHHSLKVYEELVHVPLVIRFPEGLYGGTVINDLVRLLDLTPTMVDWLKIHKPEKWIGSSLLPILTGKARLKSKAGIIEGEIKHGHNIVAYRSKKWKFILDEKRKTRELYDLKNDPKEKEDLSTVMLDKASEFEAEINRHLLRTAGSLVSLPKIDQDRLLKERLKALGYFE